MSADPHDLVTLYLLDGLSASEREDYEGHLTGCERCVRELRTYQNTLLYLGSAVETPPPPALRERVMGDIALMQQARQRSQPRPARPRRLSLAVVTTTLLLLGLLAATGLIAVLWQRVTELERQNLDTAELEISAVLAADDTRIVRIEGDIEGDLRLVYAQSLDRALLVANGLEDPPDDRTYQLWLLRGEEPASAGVLGAGRAGVIAELTGLMNVDEVVLSVEPAGGSDAPTGPIVARGLL